MDKYKRDMEEMIRKILELKEVQDFFGDEKKRKRFAQELREILALRDSDLQDDGSERNPTKKESEMIEEVCEKLKYDPSKFPFFKRIHYFFLELFWHANR